MAETAPPVKPPSPSSGRYVLLGFLWIALYLALVLTPVIALFLGSSAGGIGFWYDFSLALGFAGTAMIGVQFILTARFKRATAPYGIDIIYYFHRYAAVVGFLLILAHPIILFIDNPAMLGFLNPIDAPWHMTAGLLALLAMLVIVLTSLFRRRWNIDYDRWRIGHSVLAVVGLGLALLHIQGVGYYVAEPWLGGLWLLIAASWIGLLAYVRLLRPILLLRRPYRVAAVRPERGDSWTLSLEPIEHPGFSFEPGQFVWLTLGHSPFALREHPFSISSAPQSAPVIQVTIKELGDFTRTIGRTEVGAIAYLDGPYGAFSMDRYPDAGGYVFIAGGIGVAPMMSMLRTLAARGDRRAHVVICAHSSWERVVFREELAELSESLNLKVVHVLEHPPADWRGEMGYVTSALLDRHLPEERGSMEYFLCGPEPMIELVEQGLYELGVPLSRSHTELFDLV